jgi:hypothetical protein
VIVAEVKTTDVYRISLETIARYRERLKAEGKIDSASSILIVVGREDTGELEAQVRGSRYAWDIRLISADALVKLVQLKENSDEAETGQKIRSVLTPVEYTRLDDLIDVMFTAAADVEAAIVVSEPGDVLIAEAETKQNKHEWEFTDSKLLQAKRDAIFAAIERALRIKLIKKSRALYWDPEHKTRIACTISKRYERNSLYRYWYAYHPAWDSFLREGSPSFFVLGCVDLPVAFSIPWNVIHPLLGSLYTTETNRSRMYWHIHIGETQTGTYELSLPKGDRNLLLDPYRVAL